MKRYAYLILGILSLLYILSCAKDDEIISPNQDEVIVSDDVEIIDSLSTRKLISINGDNYTFTGYEDAKAGDIIVSDVSKLAPKGFLRKVVEVNSEGKNVSLLTEQASLTEVFKKCIISSEISLDTMKIDSVWFADGVKSLNEQSKYGTSLDVIFYDNDGNNNTTDDQIRLSGNIQFTPSIILDFEIDDWALKSFEIAVQFEQELNTLAEIGYVKDISFSEKKIATFYIGTFTIPTPLFGLPLVITPTVDLYVKADGSISANAKYSVVRTETNKSGAVYENSQWSEIQFHSESISYNNLEVNGDIDFKAVIGARLTTLFYGVAGPYISAEGYGRIEGDAHIEVDLVSVGYKLCAGVDANIGLIMTIFSNVILDESISFNLFEKILKQGEFTFGYKPVAFITNPDNNSTFENGENITFQGYGEDPQDGVITNNISWSSDIDGFLGNGTPFNCNTLSAGTHLITMLVADSDGYTGTASINVIINEPEEEEYITVTSPNGGESWTAGTSYNITWTDNISENVKIELYKGGTFNSTINSSTASDGTYSWTVPTSLTTGSDYKIRITSTTWSSLYDESNSNFTITILEGDIRLEVKNISVGSSSYPGSDGFVELWDGNPDGTGIKVSSKYTNSDAIVFFYNLDVSGDYYCDIYHDSDTYFGREYWGKEYFGTIYADATTPKTFTRCTPYLLEFKVYQNGNNVTGGNVQINVPIKIECTVTNDWLAFSTRIRLILSKTQSTSSPQFDETSSNYSTSPGIMTKIEFEFTPTSIGSYYNIYGVYMSRSGDWLISDSGAWSSNALFTVIVK